MNQNQRSAFSEKQPQQQEVGEDRLQGQEQDQGQQQEETYQQVQEADAEAETQQYYDPNQYQNYYYDPADGNYYYYPAQETAVNEEIPNIDETPITAENLIRSYEFEDWEPRSYCWFIDIVIETFMSKEFRLYFTFLLLCAGALLFTLAMSWTFQILFRLFSPPSAEFDGNWQALGFLAIFFFLSFTLVSAFCTWYDMLRGLWYVKREDAVFWGMSHQYFSRQKPPYVIYLILVVATTFFPLMYALIDAAQNKQSIVYFGQSYAFISVITTQSIVAICYLWFYIRALLQKRLAFNRRKKCDEFHLWTKSSKHHTKLKKKRWYHASTVLEEYGLDGKTLRWNAVVFTIGCVSLFALYASQSLSTYLGDPPVIWGAVSSLALTSIYVVAWMTLFRTRAHWSLYASVFLIILLLVLGLIGSGISSSKEGVITIIVLFIVSQAMLTRKRRHALTRRELCALFNIPLDSEIQHDMQRRRFDTYLICCRDTILRYLKCFDVKTYFGYRHPDVVRAEREYALHNVALITDQKVLMYWWLIVMFALAFVIAVGNTMVNRFTTSIAGIGSSLSGSDPNISFCQTSYNTNGSAPLGVYDVTLLSALSYTLATYGDDDFATWFSHLPNLIRQYPVHLPPNLNYATNGIYIPFFDYVDLMSDFHFITLGSNNRGLSLMRNVDEWSSSLAVQVAGAISPLINIWSEKYRRQFVFGASFFQRMFPHSIALRNVSSYIENMISAGKKDRILIIGDEFNGGYAKILSSMYNVTFAAFNPPGTKYKTSLRVNGLQISFTRSLLSYIDSLEDTADTVFLECDEGISSARCSNIVTTINAVRNVCGDRRGRYIK